MLTITNPGGLSTSMNFQVGPSGGPNLQPSISLITPSPVPLAQVATLTVNGSNFQSGFTASVTVGGTNYPLSPSNMIFVSATQVQIPIYMGGSSAYTATLTITNPGSLSTSKRSEER